MKDRIYQFRKILNGFRKLGRNGFSRDEYLEEEI